MRDQLRAFFARGVAAADPFDAVAQDLAADPMQVAPSLIIAIGKAARRMAQAGLVAHPNARAIVVTNYENAVDLEGAEVFGTGHPVPDKNGERAAVKIIQAIDNTDINASILVMISGGGSALLPAPAEGITLADKSEVSRLLLASGADISEMNLLRQQLSRLKGGGLSRRANPRPMRAYILSDVIGDDLNVIASGLTANAIGTPRDALDIIARLGLANTMPAAVIAHLKSQRPQMQPSHCDNRLIGSNGKSLRYMARGTGIKLIKNPVIGDVQQAAKTICDACEIGLTMWGGETTVQIRGTGKGGRNQELALRIAVEAQTRGWTGEWACLQGGTDGRDGPTDAAGGLVDHTTLKRIAAAGLDVRAMLENNDAYHALQGADALLMTGATGTNVADLGLMIRR